MREIWQEYDCPVGGDADVFKDDLMYFGQAFKCFHCEKEHKAGVDATIQTFIVGNDGEMQLIAMPNNLGELNALRNQYDDPWPTN